MEEQPITRPRDPRPRWSGRAGPPVGEVLAGIEAGALADDVHEDALAARELARALVGERLLLDRLRAALGSGEVTVVLRGGETLHGVVAEVGRDAIRLSASVDGRAWWIPVWGIGGVRALPAATRPAPAAPAARLGFTAALRHWSESGLPVTLRCDALVSPGLGASSSGWLSGRLLGVGADHVDILESDGGLVGCAGVSAAPVTMTVPLDSLTAVAGARCVPGD